MMRILILFAACLLVSGTALAVPAINLSPMKGEKSVREKTVKATKNFTGMCGAATVIVKGLEKILEGFYTFSTDGTGKIIVRPTSGAQLVIDDYPVLNDFNGVACVSTKAGKRLLLWSGCGGNACPQRFSFFVIDPEHAVFIAPKDPNKETCDALCAEDLLGSDLPEDVDDAL